MDTVFGYHLPKALQGDFAKIVQNISEAEGEVSPERIYDTFRNEYIENEDPFQFVYQKLTDISEDTENEYERKVEFVIMVKNVQLLVMVMVQLMQLRMPSMIMATIIFTY